MNAYLISIYEHSKIRYDFAQTREDAENAMGKYIIGKQVLRSTMSQCELVLEDGSVAFVVIVPVVVRTRKEEK